MPGPRVWRCARSTVAALAAAASASAAALQEYLEEHDGELGRSLEREEALDAQLSSLQVCVCVYGGACVCVEVLNTSPN